MGLLTAFAAFLSSYLATQNTQSTVRSCSSSGALFKITELHLDPAAPSPGQEVALTLSYEVPEGILVTDGTSSFEATFNFIPLTPTLQPLCEDVACPITSGAKTNTTRSIWPSGVTGSFTTKMHWNLLTGDELLCVEIGGKLGAGGESEERRDYFEWNQQEIPYPKMRGSKRYNRAERA